MAVRRKDTPLSTASAAASTAASGAGTPTRKEEETRPETGSQKSKRLTASDRYKSSASSRSAPRKAELHKRSKKAFLGARASAKTRDGGKASKGASGGKKAGAARAGTKEKRPPHAGRLEDFGLHEGGEHGGKLGSSATAQVGRILESGQWKRLREGETLTVQDDRGVGGKVASAEAKVDWDKSYTMERVHEKGEPSSKLRLRVGRGGGPSVGVPGVGRLSGRDGGTETYEFDLSKEGERKLAQDLLAGRADRGELAKRRVGDSLSHELRATAGRELKLGGSELGAKLGGELSAARSVTVSHRRSSEGRAETVATVERSSEHKMNGDVKVRGPSGEVEFKKDEEVGRKTSMSLIYNDRDVLDRMELSTTYSQKLPDGRTRELTQTKVFPDPNLEPDSPEYAEQINTLFEIAGGAGPIRRKQAMEDYMNLSGPGIAADAIEGAFDHASKQLDKGKQSTEMRIIEAGDTSGGSLWIAERSTKSTSSQVVDP